MFSLNKDKVSWVNWSQIHKCEPEGFFYPESEEELCSFLKENKTKKFRIVGSGHSFSPIVPTNSILISLDKLQGIIHIDQDEKTAECYAGTKLNILSELLHAKDLGLINMGDIDKQSLAGALCSGTHGTGIDLGILSSSIIEFTVVTVAGDIVTCNSNSNKDIFDLARVNLGLIGIVIKLKINVISAYKLHFVSSKQNLHEGLDSLDEKLQNRHFEFFWFPHTEVIQSRISNITNENIKEKSLIKEKIDYFTENDLFKQVSNFTRLVPSISRFVSKLCARVVGVEDRINFSNKIFANDRDVRFQEMEIAIPIEYTKEAILKIHEVIKQNKIAVHFPIEVRFSKRDDIALSPCYGRDTCFMAFHMYIGMEYKPYFNLIQDTLKQYNGRPHWGKLSFLEKEDYVSLFPRFSEFTDLRRKMDPNNQLLNSWLEKIFT
jgi:FAD-linked oxidoreductase